MKKYKILGWNPNHKIPLWWMERKVEFPQIGKTIIFPYVDGDEVAILINTKIGERWFWTKWFIYEEI